METCSIFFHFVLKPWRKIGRSIFQSNFSGDQLAPTHWIFHGTALNFHRMMVEKKEKQVQICLNEVRIIWLN